MLLFINSTQFLYIQVFNISIHLMLLFITSGLFSNKSFTNFNTSHVTVYHRVDGGIDQTFYISIHLMLLFIGRRWLCINADLLFQYISCYCLSVFYGVLLLNPFQFQYISCYCLSKGEVFITSTFTDFNTSHVTVYPHDQRR